MHIYGHLVSYALLSAYNLSACIMEDLAVFKAWTMTTDSNSNNLELRTMQGTIGMRIAWVYITVKTAMTLYTPFVVREEPMLWWCGGAMAVSWGSSFLVQVPLQLRIRKTGDRAALDRLARTTKVRTWSMAFHAGAVVWVLLQKL